MIALANLLSGAAMDRLSLEGNHVASEACPVCGDEVDADDLDPHGHFDSDDDSCAICGDEHFVVGNTPDHEWTNGT